MDKTSVDASFEQSFTQPVIKLGKWTLLLAIPLSFPPAIYLWLRYGALPPLGAILTGWFLIASIYGSWYFVEPISYFPVLGLSGTYMSFLSGNIANMRVPCSAVAQEVIGVGSGTKEAEIVATIGIAGSIITNVIVVTIAAIAGNELFKFFPQPVIKAFDYVLPAIFGALFVMFSIKYPKYGVFAIAVGMLLIGAIKGIPTFIIIPICVFSTIAFSVLCFKMANKKGGSRS
jgi:hypothetical protein